MAVLEFTNVTMSQFKGITDASFDLHHKTDIIGRNGVGKTTVGIAMNLPFTGKDLSGRKNPEIHPDGMNESEPHTTVTGTIDGKPITVELFQKDLRTKKQKMEDAPVKIANKYRVNSVDKSRDAMESDFLERGIDLSLYEKLTSPSWFSSLKEADKRSSVFAMVADITDKDVALSIKDDVPYLVEKLDDLKLEEIEAQAKQNKKVASERAKALPEQIVGAQKSKVDTSGLIALKDRKSVIEKEIESKRAELNIVPVITAESIETSVRELRNKQRVLVAEANQKTHLAVQEAQIHADSLNQTLTSMKFSTDNRMERARRRQNDIDYMKNQIDEMLVRYNALKAEKFPEDKENCPTCGQKLPSDKLDALKAKWLDSKNSRLAEMKEEGNNLAKRMKSVQAEIEEDRKETEEAKAKLESVKTAYTEASQVLETARKTPFLTVDDLPECKALEDEISRLYEQKKGIDKVEAERVKKMSEIDSLISELRSIERELAKEDFNKRVDENIALMKEEKRKAAQNLADAESILYQIALLNQHKNEMLTDAVNSHFTDFIRFKLFKSLKNGEIVNCCEPEILNENGEWKSYSATANNSLRLRADIAILMAFQRFHKTYLPIIVDNAECLDANSKAKISADTQLIFLSVADDTDLTVKEI